MKRQPPPPGETHTFKKRAQKLKCTPPRMLRTMCSEEAQGLHHCPLSIPGVVHSHLCSHRDQQAPLPLPTPSLPHELTSVFFHNIQLSPFSSAWSHHSRFTLGSQLAACVSDSKKDPFQAAQTAASPKEAERGSHLRTAQLRSKPATSALQTSHPSSILAGSDQNQAVGPALFRGTDNC